MRPTTSAMLQQNNNNNYPCLNMSGSTREILQKCSKASLPLPSRLELGLGDLPLIRGLRAWALCSKNRRKGGGFTGGGQAPTAPPAGRRGSTSCPRPAGVYLSGEWGRMGYGLPFGLDAGQAGIGALVTVATLKTSEGSGKTQTQCLFLRTEKGSCLYSTAKPDSGVISSTGSGVVRGWLRGKTGGGGRDTPGGRRDHGLTPPAQTGANRVRVRSGRRWRKSCSAAGREKTGMSKETQQSSREDRAGEIILGERKEERDKGGLDSKQIPSLQEDIGEARHEKEGASPRCCHNVPSRTCILSERRAQRRESHEGGESPRRGVPNRLNSEVKAMRKERQRNEEEENGGLCSLESSNSFLAALNPDLEYNRFQPESHSSQEARGTENNEEMKTQTSHNKDVSMVREEETHSRVMKIHPNNDSIHGQPEWDFAISHNRDSDDRKQSENPCEGIVTNAKGFSDCMEVRQDSERDMERVDEKEGIINHTAEFWEASKCCEDLPVSTCPLSISAAVILLPSHPVEGSTCNGDHNTCDVLRAPVSSKEYHLERFQQSVTDSGIEDKEELDGRRFEQQELDCVSDENNTVNENRKLQFFFKNVEKRSREEKNASPTPLNHADGSIFEVDGRVTIENSCDYSTTELTGTEWRDELLKENRAEESQTENVGQGVNREERDEAGGLWVRVSACIELDDADGEGDKNDINESETREEDDKGVTLECALKDSWREAVDGCRGRREEVGDTCGPESTTHIGANGETSTNFTYFGCADPSTSPGLPPANPAPSLPPLGSMATSLPRLEVEKEEEGVSLKTGNKEGGREGKTRHGRELEEQGEEKRGSAVANEEKGTEEEDEEEFGVFMQAEGEPTWCEGSAMSASVPCGSRVSVAHGNHAISRESIHWTPGWTDSSLHQSDDTWTAFPQDSADERRDIVGQWWPASTVEEGKDRLSTNQNLVAVFAEAFPSLPRLSASDPSGLDTVPTLTQLLRGKASQDQGLLDGFHNLNKIICQRYKRATGMSRDLLLKTLHLEQPHSESRPASWAASRFSPGLPSANHHAQNAAAKRRLSYDCNRNIME